MDGQLAILPCVLRECCDRYCLQPEISNKLGQFRDRVLPSVWDDKEGLRMRACSQRRHGKDFDEIPSMALAAVCFALDCRDNLSITQDGEI
ncbi:hypothetical protein AAFO90_22985 [Phaeobacter sp. CAU 1743]